jgi:sulfur relay (sulfurtransferase) DsrC/TusE family protein
VCCPLKDQNIKQQIAMTTDFWPLITCGRRYYKVFNQCHLQRMTENPEPKDEDTGETNALNFMERKEGL